LSTPPSNKGTEDEKCESAKCYLVEMSSHAAFRLIGERRSDDDGGELDDVVGDVIGELDTDFWVKSKRGSSTP